MGSTTYVGRALRAAQFEESNEFWAVIGRTTVWDNEALPPDDPIDVDTVAEPICYVKCSTVSLGKMVESDPDIIINSQGYEYVANEDAIAEGGRFLILVATFDPNTQPYGNFRQIGFFAGMTPTAGHESDEWLAPASVLEEGTLIYIHNDIVTTMSPTREEEIKIALEFR